MLTFSRAYCVKTINRIVLQVWKKNLPGNLNTSEFLQTWNDYIAQWGKKMFRLLVVQRSCLVVWVEYIRRYLSWVLWVRGVVGAYEIAQNDMILMKFYCKCDSRYRTPWSLCFHSSKARNRQDLFSIQKLFGIGVITSGWLYLHKNVSLNDLNVLHNILYITEHPIFAKTEIFLYFSSMDVTSQWALPVGTRP